jgi:DNA modification methylase
MELNRIYQGDVLDNLRSFPSGSFKLCVTSPPYWKLRNYNVKGQLGQEADYKDYLRKLEDIAEEIWRVLDEDGSFWINLGDTRAGNKKGNTNGTYGRVAQKADVNRMEIQKKAPANIAKGSLIGIPDRFKTAMIDKGWICRNEIIWYKRNAMPEGAKKRFTIDYEKFFFFVKSEKAYFETQYEPIKEESLEAAMRGVKFGGNKAEGYERGTYSGKAWTPKVREFRIDTRPGLNTGNGKSGKAEDPNAGLHNSDLSRKRQKIIREIDGKLYGRIKRSVWDITTKGFRGAHFAVFPEDLIEIPIRACCPPGGTVLDPFMGSGTTAVAALKQQKNFVGIELNPNYIQIAEKRIAPLLPPLAIA